MGLPLFRQSRKPCMVFTVHKLFTASAFFTESISLLSNRDSWITHHSKRLFGIFRTTLPRLPERHIKSIYSIAYLNIFSYLHMGWQFGASSGEALCRRRSIQIVTPAESGNQIQFSYLLWDRNFVLTQTWRYWKHWGFRIIRDSKRVFGIFRTLLPRLPESNLKKHLP